MYFADVQEEQMQLSDIVSVEKIKVPMVAKSKRQAIEELVDVLIAAGDVSSREIALSAVLEREKTRTTGIGNGLAIPHGKCSAVNQVVMALGRPANGIDFESVDEKPVNLVILLLSPMDMIGPHIQALARISRLMSIDGLRKQITCAQEPAQIMQALRDAEQIEAKA